MWGSIFIVFGIFLAFFGRKLLPIAIFIIFTFLLTTIVLTILYSTVLANNTTPWISWTVVSLSIVAGVAGGFLGIKLQRMSAVIIAAWGGFCLGILLNESVLYMFKNETLFWCVNIGLAIVFGFLALAFFNEAVILSTSFVGSYLTMRGIGLMAGGFPNETVLIH